MPTYEYECQSCHQRVEAVQKFSDPDLTVCANCGGELRKVFSAVGIVFKGSGFYATDSRRGSAGIAPGSGAKKPSPGSDGDKAAPGAGGDPTPSTGAAGTGAAVASDSKGPSAGTTAA